MRTPLGIVAPTAAEVAARRPGDELIEDPDAVMDRGLTLPGSPEVVWPWLVQLGKQRAGWYLSRRVERLVPQGRRASRTIEARWQELGVGDVIPDWGGRDETFRCERIHAPSHLVYSSRRGQTDLSWLLHLSPSREGAETRLHLRLRLAPVKHPRIAAVLGGAFDAVTIAGLAGGLRERLREGPARP